MTALWQFAVAALLCLTVFGVFVWWESWLVRHPRGKYRGPR